MRNVVIIPIYKTKPNWGENLSFNQCIKVFAQHVIVIVTYSELNISNYTNLFVGTGNEFKVEFFKKKYFKDLSGYNKLLLSKEFYQRFNGFEYMLIYQLDAWVFRDELDYWCNRGYDYIGAPWFEKCGLHENGNKLWAVGNGGFSLRRISSFLNIFYYKRPLFKIKGLKAIHPKKKRFVGKLSTILIICIKRSGWRNNSNYFLKKFVKNEDGFWSVFLQRSRKPIKTPTCEEALKFSFESSPSFLFELNGKRLPFGCHAWEKNEYNSFWKDFIKDQE
jgi:hypothetical protein